jgi:AraC-like DNA-binding protein
MKTFKLHIKNMLCDRCIYVVQQILVQFNVLKVKVELGQVSFLSNEEDMLPLLERKLNEFNLQILNTKEGKMVEAIKLEVKHYLDEVEQHDMPGKVSAFISNRLAKNYHNLSKLFSHNEKMTIETYFIKQRIERVKRLLREDQLSSNGIADRLHYTNVQHLSAQFRKVTGLSVREYKKLQPVDHPHKSITQVLSEIRAKGYLNAFDVTKDNNILLDQTEKLIDVSVKEVYRFDETPNSLGRNAICTVDYGDGSKGYLFCQP